MVVEKGVYISSAARANFLCDCRMTISRRLGATGSVQHNRWNNALLQNAGWLSILYCLFIFIRSFFLVTNFLLIVSKSVIAEIK